MESRMEKYYNNDIQEYSRSKKNTNLYKEVYGSYSQLEYLPVSDNVSEIDASRLKEIVASREDYQKSKSSQVALMEERPVKKYEEQKVYDINELIEKARNSKPKVQAPKENIQSYNFLKTLESNELLKSQINEAKKLEEIKQEQIINKQTTNTLSLDILSDLKPTGDTVVMEPISTSDKNTLNDIPIDNRIKDDNDKTFYSGSYKFSKSDFFEEDDDFSDLKKKSSFGKAILIIVMLSICITGVYFLIKFLGTR